jgi:hypothetical protein
MPFSNTIPVPEKEERGFHEYLGIDHLDKLRIYG